MSFKYDLNQSVQIKISGEQGQIKARAEYTSSEPMYWLEYKSTTGTVKQEWFYEGSLTNI